MPNATSPELTDKLLFFFPNGFKGITRVKDLHVKRQEFITKDLARVRKSYEAAALSTVTPLDQLTKSKEEVSEYFVSLQQLFDTEVALWARLRRAFENQDEDMIARVLDLIKETLAQEWALLPAKTDEKSLKSYLDMVTKKSRAQMGKMRKD